MSDERTWVTHIFAWLFAVTIFVFTYAVLVEGGGLWHAVGGFVIGFMLLFYLYGQSLDHFYFHVGDRLKIGGDAFDPDNERQE